MIWSDKKYHFLSSENGIDYFYEVRQGYETRFHNCQIHFSEGRYDLCKI